MSTTFYTPAINAAIRFALKTHEMYQKQKRKGKDIPYIIHPMTVGLLLARAGASEDAVIAGILHDTVEDSIEEKKVTQEMIAERFGESVAELVMSVTEKDKCLSWQERKDEALEHIQTYSQDSLLVKSADVICNTAELIDDVRREGSDAVFERFNAPKEKIIEQTLKVIDTLRIKWPENPFDPDLENIADKVRDLDRK